MPRVVAFLCILVLLHCGDQDVFLKFNFGGKPNRQYRIDYTLKGRIRNDSQSFLSSGSFRAIQNVEHQYPNGDAKVLIQIDSVSQKTDFLSQAEQEHLSTLLGHSPLRVRLSPYGDFLEINPVAEFPSIDFFGFDVVRLLVEIYPILPHTGIPVGGEWDREQQFPFDNGASKGTVYLRKHFRLAGLEKRGTRMCARIALDLLVNLGMAQGQAFSAKSEQGSFAKGTGTLYFDLAEGCFVEAKANIRGAMEAGMQTGQSRFTCPLVYEQTAHLSLSGSK